MDHIRDIVAAIAKVLVDNPDDVTVTVTEAEEFTVLELRVLQTDLGKIIGKGGRMASSIRRIVMAAGMTQKRLVKLQIME